MTYFVIKREISIPHARTGSMQIDVHSDPPLYFFALGDTGSGDSNQYAVAAAMEKRCRELPKLDGFLLLGDQFYMTGVTSISDKQWKEKIFTPYGSECLNKSKIYPIFGNHDYVGNKDAWIQYSAIHPRWNMPNRFYSVNFSNLLKLIAIDSNFADLCWTPEHCVVNFLIQELQTSFRWKIVLSHHPLSSGSLKKFQHTGDTVFGKLFRWLACGKTDLWVSGHAHHLEHRVLKTCASDLFISGGGGGELEDVDDESLESLFSMSEFGFLELEVTQASITARFFDTNSKMLYQKEITKP